MTIVNIDMNIIVTLVMPTSVIPMVIIIATAATLPNHLLNMSLGGRERSRRLEYNKS